MTDDQPSIQIDVRPSNGDRLPSEDPPPVPLAEDHLGEPVPAVEPYDADADQAAVAQSEAARSASIGPEVDATEGDPRLTDKSPTFTSPLEAFLSDKATEVPTRRVVLERANGFRVELTIRAVPTPRYNRIIEDHTTWRRDRDTGERIQDTKSREVKAELIIYAVQDIEFNHKGLWERYGATDRHSLVERMFLRGEIERLVDAIARVSGFDEAGLEDVPGNF